MSAIYVEILSVKGSVPRDAGTAMKVEAQDIAGTIGGGALEWAAIAQARSMLESGADETTRTLPLGPGLGQCCGGSVTLQFGRAPRQVDVAPGVAPPLRPRPEAPPLWLWGAGHVGRAVVAACPTADFDVTWIDSAQDRFPKAIRSGVRGVPVADMARFAGHAPLKAHHLVFTYSHEIDLALCAALLQRGFASCGVIGSATKWARFGKRLRAAGLDPDSITCPIGDKSRGKHPRDIAEGCIAALLSAREAAA
ncbi:xanthine dehydrogenase accessory protein XdhC [uncultured Roseobacter sp.]|uniref:xanthine dehydrogenase accessory protein XdhC n=1 Tax=uncultured Roseobacter sp. TaxID=114847 RepID=UPI00261FB43F|nr:xanthine dehydrogenase accessory protein XdhC [uncultured Roseobacter sp.]